MHHRARDNRLVVDDSRDDPAETVCVDRSRNVADSARANRVKLVLYVAHLGKHQDRTGWCSPTDSAHRGKILPGDIASDQADVWLKPRRETDRMLDIVGLGADPELIPERHSY